MIAALFSELFGAQMEEAGGPDRLIPNILATIGWILVLIGLEPVAAFVIAGGAAPSVIAVVVFVFVGLLLMAQAHYWPPSKPKIRSLLTAVLAPIASKPRIWSLGLVLVLWVSA